MSLILDALRKMELERKAKRQGSAEIRAEVLNYHGKAHTPEKTRLLPVIAALLLLSSATAFFLYFKGSGSPPAEQVKTAAPLQVETPLQTTVPRPEPLPLPSAKAAQPAAVNTSPESSRPAAVKEEPRQPSDGNDIEVSGIAWQEERQLRRAVINGALMGEGAEVSGARVVEIRENLVRFSRGGSTFEVIYSSGAGR